MTLPYDPSTGPLDGRRIEDPVFGCRMRELLLAFGSVEIGGRHSCCRIGPGSRLRRQLPVFAASAGFDAKAPYFIAGVMVLPVLAALLMRPVIGRLAASETRPWAPP